MMEISDGGKYGNKYRGRHSFPQLPDLFCFTSHVPVLELVGTIATVAARQLVKYSKVNLSQPKGLPPPVCTATGAHGTALALS